MEFLSQEAFAGWTWLEALGIGVSVFIIASVLKAVLFGRRQQASHLVQLSCQSCGWSGRASEISRRCPSCNGRIA
jgi:predicted Zn-ribbon and HTH transcriptional regulator